MCAARSFCRRLSCLIPRWSGGSVAGSARGQRFGSRRCPLVAPLPSRSTSCKRFRLLGFKVTQLCLRAQSRRCGATRFRVARRGVSLLRQRHIPRRRAGCVVAPATGNGGQGVATAAARLHPAPLCLPFPRCAPVAPVRSVSSGGRKGTL